MIVNLEIGQGKRIQKLSSVSNRKIGENFIDVKVKLNYIYKTFGRELLILVFQYQTDVSQKISKNIFVEAVPDGGNVFSGVGHVQVVIFC